MRVYVLSYRCHGEEHIIQAVLTEEGLAAAKQAGLIQDGIDRVDSFEVDAAVPALKKGFRPYLVRFDYIDGAVVQDEAEEWEERYWTSSRSATVFALSPEEAVKRAETLRAGGAPDEMQRL